MIILVEHGMVSHVIAARLIYHCAPEAMQAAVAAALCGAGSVHLGSSEWSAKMLAEALPGRHQEPRLRRNRHLDHRRLHEAQTAHARHRPSDSCRRRSARRDAFQHRPEHGSLRQILRADPAALESLHRPAQALDSGQRHRRHRAIALDMGYPWQISKAFALIGRTLGAIGHIAEEIQNPMAPQIDAARSSKRWSTNRCEA